MQLPVPRGEWICRGSASPSQNLENPRLRRRLGLRDDESGVMVVSVEYGGSCYGVLQPRDAILAIDGLAIANNGTVRYRQRYRTRYDVVLGDHFVGDEMSLTVMRQGQRQDVRIRLEPLVYLVPRAQYDVQPTYFVYGGLVFQVLSRDFLGTWDKWWNKAPKEFLYYYYSGVRTAARHEVVVLTQVLADELNVGYAHLYNEAIEEINGHVPRNMHDFVTELEASHGVIEIRCSSSGLIVLDADEVAAANQRILDRYHIARDRSEDLPGAPHSGVIHG